MTEKCDLVLNLSGIHCPYSLLELNGTFKDIRVGATLEILADRASIVDEVRYWCEATGNQIVSVENEAVTGRSSADGSGTGGAVDESEDVQATIRLVLRKT